MMGEFMSHLRDRVRQWWRAPITVADRIGAAVFGLFGFFFIGAIGRALLGARPVGFDTLAMWGVWSSGAGLLIGIRFPKVTTCLLAPLMLIGG
jgi:hypothetical protein